MVKIIDHHFLNHEKLIASFLLETEAGLVLIESGPGSTFPSLKAGVEQLGHKIEDVRHVLLTHIHLDHAGGAFELAKRGAVVYAHPLGIPHLAAPEKLYASAKRIYREDMERLWGNIEPIPQTQLKAIEADAVLEFGGHKIECHYTPGHASHHIVFQLGASVFAGDLAGVCLVDVSSKLVDFACPPPELDLALWRASIDKVLALNPAQMYLTHYGVVSEVKQHFEYFFQRVEAYMHFIKERLTPEGLATFSPQQQAALTQEFTAYVEENFRREGVNEKQLQRLIEVNPPYMTVMGILRYYKKNGLA